MLIERATGHGNGIVEVTLANEGDDLALLLQVGRFGSAKSLVKATLLTTGDTLLIRRVSRTQLSTQFIGKAQVPLKLIRLTTEHQPQRHGTQTQDVLADLPQRHHTWQPMLIDCLGLLAHLAHLEQ